MRAFPGIRRHSVAMASSRRCKCCGSIRRSRAACCGGWHSFRPRPIDPAADAQPGKILHEMRAGEMAMLGEVPFRLYYGTVDATPLFVLLAGAYLDRTGDMRTIVELWPAIEAALSWIDGTAMRTATASSNTGAQPNKGLPIRAGRICSMRSSGPMAAWSRAMSRWPKCKVTSLRPNSRQRAAPGKWDCRSARSRWNSGRAARGALRGGLLVSGAQQLRAGAGWRESAVPGADLQRRTSVVQRHRQPRARRQGRRQLLEPPILFGLGHPHRGQGGGPLQSDVLSQRFDLAARQRADRARFCPIRATSPRSTQLFKGLFDAATYMDLRRLPELFCGFKRQPSRGPTLYPVACAPQAWASATPFTLLEASLGLEFDPANNEIRLRNPRLPAFIDDVLLRNLQLGDARVDLRIRRVRDEVAIDMVRSRGKMQVSIVFSA